MKTCKFCGQELVDGALFCGNCGKKCEEPLEAVETDGSQEEWKREWQQKEKQQEEELQNEEPEVFQEIGQGGNDGGYGIKKKSFIPIIVGGIFLMAAAAAGSFLALKHWNKGEESGSFGLNKAQEEEFFDLSSAELVDNYKPPEGVGMIDLKARNYQPGARDMSARWNKELFYWLEDIGGEDDNHIADCILTRMELVRTDSGTPVEYEVYRDSETGQIQKIVSIETREDGRLELSDYYYQDGKPDFVFRRDDSIYTPSYATIDKTGERYYFSGDQMVKWRWIYEPSVVKQWILEPEDTWYTQWGYGEISDNERAQYDEKELQVLNEAYNTYEAIYANKPADLIRGCVTDEGGNPLEGVQVGIGTIAEGEVKKPEVKVETDGNGRYAWAMDIRCSKATRRIWYF